MGKLLIGRYGELPGAESMEFTLRDAHQRLGLKPSDFISTGEPKFFYRSFDAGGRYLVLLLTDKEVEGQGVWKSGYYLLPMSAADALKSFGKNRVVPAGGRRLPVTIESKTELPPDVKARVDQWVLECQPLFFKCQCDHLEMKVDAPWALRRRWRARLKCADRCQPTLTQLL